MATVVGDAKSGDERRSHDGTNYREDIISILEC